MSKQSKQRILLLLVALFMITGCSKLKSISERELIGQTKPDKEEDQVVKEDKDESEEIVPEKKDELIGYMVTPDLGLRLRSKPNTDSEVLTTAKKHAVIFGKKASNGWVEVDWNNYKGYMSSDYLEEIKRDDSMITAMDILGPKDIYSMFTPGIAEFGDITRFEGVMQVDRVYIGYKHNYTDYDETTDGTIFEGIDSSGNKFSIMKTDSDECGGTHYNLNEQEELDISKDDRAILDLFWYGYVQNEFSPLIGVNDFNVKWTKDVIEYENRILAEWDKKVLESKDISIKIEKAYFNFDNYTQLDNLGEYIDTEINKCTKNVFLRDTPEGGRKIDKIHFVTLLDLFGDDSQDKIDQSKYEWNIYSDTSKQCKPSGRCPDNVDGIKIHDKDFFHIKQELIDK